MDGERPLVPGNYPADVTAGPVPGTRIGGANPNSPNSHHTSLISHVPSHLTSHLALTISSTTPLSIHPRHFNAYRSHISTMAEPFVFPREYHFPPFFTRQTNLTTHHAQLTKWSTLILSFCQHHRIFKLSLSSFNPSQQAPSSNPTPSSENAAPTETLFHNPKINRRLSTADIKEVIAFMRKQGTAEPAGEDGDVVWIHWRRPEEWAASVEKWVEETAHRGMVLTVYELTEGETCRGTGKSGTPFAHMGSED